MRPAEAKGITLTKTSVPLSGLEPDPPDGHSPRWSSVTRPCFVQEAEPRDYDATYA